MFSILWFSAGVIFAFQRTSGRSGNFVISRKGMPLAFTRMIQKSYNAQNSPFPHPDKVIQSQMSMMLRYGILAVE